MKKKILLVTAALLLGFTIFYQYKRQQFTKTYAPQIETVSSIVDYAQKHSIDAPLYVAKSAESLEALQHYFSYATLFVLDSNKNVLDCNYIKLGGRCFQDISDDLCSQEAFEAQELDLPFSGKDFLDVIDRHTLVINPSDAPKTSPKRIIIYPWVKYAPSCVESSSIAFIRCINDAKDSEDVLIIALNLDTIDHQGS